MKMMVHAVALGAVLLGGCGEKPSGSSAASSATTPADATYTVRGRIEGLPTPDGKAYLHIHHEAIPEFKGRDGTVSGMDEMSMDFLGLAPGVDLSQVRVGDPIEFTFEVRWKADPRSLVTRVKKLAPDVKLNLSGEPK